MTTKVITILFGGIIPAILFASTGIFQKLSARAGLSPGYTLIGVGIMIVIIGLSYNLIDKNATFNPSGMGYAILFGFAWAIAAGLISIVLVKYNGNMSQLAPLTSLSTIITVLLALFVLRESHDINIVRIIAAAILMSIGAVLTATA